MSSPLPRALPRAATGAETQWRGMPRWSKEGRQPSPLTRALSNDAMSQRAYCGLTLFRIQPARPQAAVSLGPARLQKVVLSVSLHAPTSNPSSGRGSRLGWRATSMWYWHPSLAMRSWQVPRRAARRRAKYLPHPRSTVQLQPSSTRSTRSTLRMLMEDVDELGTL